MQTRWPQISLRKLPGRDCRLSILNPEKIQPQSLWEGLVELRAEGREPSDCRLKNGRKSLRMRPKHGGRDRDCSSNLFCLKISTVNRTAGELSKVAVKRDGQTGAAKAAKPRRPRTRKYFASICPGDEIPLPDEFATKIVQLEQLLHIPIWLIIHQGICPGCGAGGEIGPDLFKGFQSEYLNWRVRSSWPAIKVSFSV